MAELLECVPNFSEGQDPAVLAAIVDVLSAAAGVAVLNHGLDAAHHRAVVTLAGSPDALCEAMLRASRVAMERIDLTAHAGVHRRMGALDVCPFVPLRDTPMAVAVATANEFGRRVAVEVGLPVYFYAEAAAVPERRVLGFIRNRGFEVIRDALAKPAATTTDDLRRELRPDVQPPGLVGLHPTAGAVAVGARPFLVAYNVQLETGDVRIARAIAKQVRESSGGLPCVQAMGFLLSTLGVAQVSTNILDYRQTSVSELFDAVERAAKERGVEIRDSELIGLVPRAALSTDSARHVRLTGFDEQRQVLEARLAAAGL